MNRVIISERFASMWRKSRERAGISQDYMSKALGVSKKTIQNWESGFSCPSQMVGFLWFDVLGVQPLPYYLELLYPELFEDLERGSEDQRIEIALDQMLRDLPIEMKRKLLFILHGDHGSSPSGLIELLIAHIHAPLDRRLNVAQDVILNYEIAESRGRISDHVKPDVDLLKRSFVHAREAVLSGSSDYSNLREDPE